MSIIGRITFLCDTPSCHAELVLDADDADLDVTKRGDVSAVFVASEWRQDDNGDLHCPECCEASEPRDTRDDDYEREAARARNNDFAETGGKDWT